MSKIEKEKQATPALVSSRQGQGDCTSAKNAQGI